MKQIKLLINSLDFPLNGTGTAGAAVGDDDRLQQLCLVAGLELVCLPRSLVAVLLWPVAAGRLGAHGSSALFI